MRFSSSIDTFWLRAFSRSISTKSCGCATLKLLNSPRSRGSWLPWNPRFCTLPWSAARPALRRSWTCSLNPPVLPSPSTGGAPKTTTRPSRTCANCFLRLSATALADSSGFPLRCSNGSRMTNIPPTLLRFVLSRIE